MIALSLHLLLIAVYNLFLSFVQLKTVFLAYNLLQPRILCLILLMKSNFLINICLFKLVWNSIEYLFGWHCLILILIKNSLLLILNYLIGRHFITLPLLFMIMLYFNFFKPLVHISFIFQLYIRINKLLFIFILFSSIWKTIPSFLIIFYRGH